jgi:hypothetical protein
MGAVIGSFFGLIDRVTFSPYPSLVLDCAIVSSTVVNAVSYLYF